MFGPIPITKNGVEKLKGELNRLKAVDRPRVISAISESRAHGDLKENAEYHAALEEQSIIERKIRELDVKLSNCVIINAKDFAKDGNVVFGSFVKLNNLDTNEVVEYEIVGVDESDLKCNKISVSSPLARAAIGKFVGDVIDVEAPCGLITYEIINIRYV